MTTTLCVSAFVGVCNAVPKERQPITDALITHAPWMADSDIRRRLQYFTSKLQTFTHGSSRGGRHHSFLICGDTIERKTQLLHAISCAMPHVCYVRILSVYVDLRTHVRARNAMSQSLAAMIDVVLNDELSYADAGSERPIVQEALPTTGRVGGHTIIQWVNANGYRLVLCIDGLEEAFRAETGQRFLRDLCVFGEDTEYPSVIVVAAGSDDNTTQKLLFREFDQLCIAEFPGYRYAPKFGDRKYEPVHIVPPANSTP